ncbi:MAG TPA: TonB family protein [Rhizomicrobium sp.]|nr:TonB family protein [Rhizomicrobium sp.]
MPTLVLTLDDIKACNHRRLRPRFILALVFAILLVPFLLALLVFGAVTLLLFWGIFLYWLTREVLYASYCNNQVLVSELNYPRINTLAREMKSLLGADKDFSVFVYEQGQFNAFMMRLFRRRAIFLNSEILETGVSDDEVRWIVGRFVGYLRAQQEAGFWGWIIRVAQRMAVFNFFMLPYERAMVYTGDRLGLAGIGGDISSAISAMQKLMVGRQLGYSVNPIGIMEQRKMMKGSLFGFLSRISSGFPPTLARYADLIAFSRRRFPEQFGRFEAANPGLPAELDELSGERTAWASVSKGIGFLVALFVAGIITLILWGALIPLAQRMGLSDESSYESPSPYESAPPPYTPPAPDTGTENQQAPSGGGEETPAPQEQQPQQSAPDNHQISDPVFDVQPSQADYDSVYPEAAREAGVTGSAIIQCSVADDGSLTSCNALQETPDGSGFGQAALGLKDKIRLNPRDGQGVPVGGGIVQIRVPFTLSQQ